VSQCLDGSVDRGDAEAAPVSVDLVQFVTGYGPVMVLERMHQQSPRGNEPRPERLRVKIGNPGLRQATLPLR